MKTKPSQPRRSLHQPLSLLASPLGTVRPSTFKATLPRQAQQLQLNLTKGIAHTLQLQQREQGSQAHPRASAHSAELRMDSPPRTGRPLGHVEQSHQSRLANYLSAEIALLSQTPEKIESYSPMLRQKMEQLKGLVEQKQQAMRGEWAVKASYCFKELKLGDIEQIRTTSAHSLHSHRSRQAESPVARNFKNRRILSRSHNLTPDVTRQAQTSEGQRRRMVLVGGKISSKWEEGKDGRSGVPLKVKRELLSYQESRAGRTARYFHRPARVRAAEMPEEENEEECRPWDFARQSKEEEMHAI